MTLQVYLIDEWLPSVRNELRHSTYESYRRNLVIMHFLAWAMLASR